MSMLSATVLLFLVIDPVGNIPLFLCSLKRVEPQRHRKVILREMLIGLAVLILFLFAGRYVLLALHTSHGALGMAGGIILLLVSIKMIFAGAEKVFEDTVDAEPLVVPLAIPMIAGPSAMTMVMLLMSGEPDRWPEWLGALLISWGASVVLLLLSDQISGLLGKRGLTAMERLMGMLLTVVSVEMFLTGLRQAMPNWGQ